MPLGRSAKKPVKKVRQVRLGGTWKEIRSENPPPVTWKPGRIALAKNEK